MSSDEYFYRGNLFFGAILITSSITGVLLNISVIGIFALDFLPAKSSWHDYKRNRLQQLKLLTMSEEKILNLLLIMLASSDLIECLILSLPKGILYVDSLQWRNIKVCYYLIYSENFFKLTSLFLMTLNAIHRFFRVFYPFQKFLSHLLLFKIMMLFMTFNIAYSCIYSYGIVNVWNFHNSTQCKTWDNVTSWSFELANTCLFFVLTITLASCHIALLSMMIHSEKKVNGNIDFRSKWRPIFLTCILSLHNIIFYLTSYIVQFWNEKNVLLKSLHFFMPSFNPILYHIHEDKFLFNALCVFERVFLCTKKEKVQPNLTRRRSSRMEMLQKKLETEI